MTVEEGRPEGRKSLVPLMRELADTGHARAAELRELASDLEVKAAGFYGNPQTVGVKSFVGAWARARRVWSEITGEPLI